MGELIQFPGSYEGETSALQKFLTKAKKNALPMASKAGSLGVGYLLLNELYQGGRFIWDEDYRNRMAERNSLVGKAKEKLGLYD